MMFATSAGERKKAKALADLEGPSMAAQPITEREPDNKGSLLLKAMGWSEGEGLTVHSFFYISPKVTRICSPHI